jgi:hypothetical protein
VQNNPILFVDPLGLDTVRSATRPENLDGRVWIQPGANGSEWIYTYNPSDPNAIQGGDYGGYVASGGTQVESVDNVTVSSGGNPNASSASTATNGGGGGAAPVNIRFGPNANQNVLTQHSRQVLADIMQASNNRSLLITSTQRTPAEQARVMYTNIVNLGVQHQLALYGAGGDAIIQVAANGRRQGLGRDQIIQNMIAEIRRVGPTRVSRHCGDPNVLNVMDISPGSIQNRQQFVREIRARGIRLLLPPADPAYHLEIPQ